VYEGIASSKKALEYRFFIQGHAHGFPLYSEPWIDRYTCSRRPCNVNITTAAAADNTVASKKGSWMRAVRAEGWTRSSRQAAGVTRRNLSGARITTIVNSFTDGQRERYTTTSIRQQPAAYEIGSLNTGIKDRLSSLL
jgi:hypothetical protein